MGTHRPCSAERHSGVCAPSHGASPRVLETECLRLNSTRDSAHTPKWTSRVGLRAKYHHCGSSRCFHTDMIQSSGAYMRCWILMNTQLRMSLLFTHTFCAGPWVSARARCTQGEGDR